MRRLRRLFALPIALALTTFSSVAWAKSWCARPLVVHEWGVQVFDARGSAIGSRAGLLPPYFHTRPGPGAGAVARVADLPPDGGERDLPVLHFTANEHDDRIPFALGVGFTAGQATSWFPQVDTFRQELVANGAASLTLRAGLVAARAQLRPSGDRPRLPDDPTRQLEWRALTLTRTPLYPTLPTEVSWVQTARALPTTLWVNGAHEAERFVFFEGKTREQVALRIARGERYTPTFRHYVLTNTSNAPIHDVFVVHRQGNDLFVFNAPAIPAGASAGFALEEHRVAAAAKEAATVGLLRRQLTATRPADTTCVMGRDPAIPVEAASGHSLFANETELLLGVWGQAFFAAEGTTIVYREDPAYLDRMVPLSLFTDMWHFIELHRAGLALWQGVVLP